MTDYPTPNWGDAPSQEDLAPFLEPPADVSGGDIAQALLNTMNWLTGGFGPVVNLGKPVVTSPALRQSIVDFGKDSVAGGLTNFNDALGIDGVTSSPQAGQPGFFERNGTTLAIYGGAGLLAFFALQKMAR